MDEFGQIDSPEFFRRSVKICYVRAHKSPNECVLSFVFFCRVYINIKLSVKQMESEEDLIIIVNVSYIIISDIEALILTEQQTV